MPGSTRTVLRPWGGKPKQNTRSPQGGGQDPKQCPGDAQSVGSEINEPMADQEIARPKSGSGEALGYAIVRRGDASGQHICNTDNLRLFTTSCMIRGRAFPLRKVGAISSWWQCLAHSRDADDWVSY
jgi:hypothetical protein